MSDPSPLELRVLLDRKPGVVTPCLVCGGRGAWPTTYSEAWVPWTGCARCAGTGEEPSRPLAQEAPPCRSCHGHGGTWIPDGAIERWRDCRACGCSGDELNDTTGGS